VTKDDELERACFLVESRVRQFHGANSDSPTVHHEVTVCFYGQSDGSHNRHEVWLSDRNLIVSGSDAESLYEAIKNAERDYETGFVVGVRRGGRSVDFPPRRHR